MRIHDRSFSHRRRLFGETAVPVFNLDTALTTFTAGMAKRTSPGPFTTGIMGQGPWAAASVGDRMAHNRGLQISGEFNEHIEMRQGSLVFWITPEWDGNDNKAHGLFQFGSSSVRHLISKSATNNLTAILPTTSQNVSVDVSGWTAGTTYCVVISWDQVNKIDGTNYVRISINDSHTFGATGTGLLASGSWQWVTGVILAANGAADALIEGYTLYRRVLFDGTYGTDVGNGDEVNLIYNAGSGQDPTRVTGAWDVTAAMPTDQLTGTFAHSLQGWSFPHNASELTDPYCQTTYGSSAWGDEGTPSTGPADSADAENIFYWGYKWTCDAANEGVTQTISGLSVRQAYVIRVIAHCTSANDIRVRIWDETNGAQIGADFDFGASSSLGAPGVALFTFELPDVANYGAGSDCTSISVKVMGTANTQEVFLHQVQLHENVIPNPSLEIGAGNPWIPDLWANDGGLAAGESSQEVVNMHSGNSCIYVNKTSSSGYPGIRKSLSLGAGDDGEYWAIGCWMQKTAAGDTPYFGTAVSGSRLESHVSPTAKFPDLTATNTGTWEHLTGVSRVDGSGSHSNVRPSGPFNDTPKFYADDAYAIQLDDLLTGGTELAPASEANSAENSGLRVDGVDTLTQPQTEAGGSWEIQWKWRPRHAAADVMDWGGTPYILDAYEDANNYCRVYWSAANTITVALNNGGGGEVTDTWDATGAIAVDTEYTGKLISDGASLVFQVDDVTRATVASAPPNIDALDANWGHDNSGANQGDAVFINP